MYCSQCGRQIPDESEFCNYCGRNIRKDEVNEVINTFEIETPENQGVPVVEDKNVKKKSSWIWIALVLMVVSITTGILSGYLKPQNLVNIIGERMFQEDEDNDIDKSSETNNSGSDSSRYKNEEIEPFRSLQTLPEIAWLTKVEMNDGIYVIIMEYTPSTTVEFSDPYIQYYAQNASYFIAKKNKNGWEKIWCSPVYDDWQLSTGTPSIYVVKNQKICMAMTLIPYPPGNNSQGAEAYVLKIANGKVDIIDEFHADFKFDLPTVNNNKIIWDLGYGKRTYTLNDSLVIKENLSMSEARIPDAVLLEFKINNIGNIEPVGSNHITLNCGDTIQLITTDEYTKELVDNGKFYNVYTFPCNEPAICEANRLDTLTYKYYDPGCYAVLMSYSEDITSEELSEKTPTFIVNVQKAAVSDELALLQAVAEWASAKYGGSPEFEPPYGNASGGDLAVGIKEINGNIANVWYGYYQTGGGRFMIFKKNSNNQWEFEEEIIYDIPEGGDIP